MFWIIFTGSVWSIWIFIKIRGSCLKSEMHCRAGFCVPFFFGERKVFKVDILNDFDMIGVMKWISF